jgi:hypothetical protein
MPTWRSQSVPRWGNMDLTPEAIVAIAEWQPAYPGFDRNDDSVCRDHIQPILDHFASSGDIGCHVLKDGGNSNYSVLFVFFVKDVPSFAFSRKVEGLLVYLNLCAPLAVVGRSRRCVDPDLISYTPLEIEGLIPPGAFSALLETITLAAIQSGGYRVLSTEEVNQPLPPRVTPWEHSFAAGPCDRVFHALFADSD